MFRRPIFDAVRELLGRGFTQKEVDALDIACDLAEAPTATDMPEPEKMNSGKIPIPDRDDGHVLGSLSEEFESSGRGPGTVSSGKSDAGGVSYGVFQLSSKKGTCSNFMKNEGKAWKDQFYKQRPGTKNFSSSWKEVASCDAKKFRKAQHAYIERTHYRPLIKIIKRTKGLDLDGCHNAVRDAAWSCSVQHKRANLIIRRAIDFVDRTEDRNSTDYDEKLVNAIYAARVIYVEGVARNTEAKDQRDQLISITKNRFPKEKAKALAMFGRPPRVRKKNSKPKNKSTTVDGNVIAAANGVLVKSASVKLTKLHPKMEAVIVSVAKQAKAMSLPQPVITSGNDSNHQSGSLHYKWRALDFRGRNLSITLANKLTAAVSAELGNEYDVLFETYSDINNNHLHVEYDPK